MNNVLGNNICFLRKSKGMTQDDLALAVGLSRITINKYEKGRSKPDIAKLHSIAAVLNTSIAVLSNPINYDTTQLSFSQVAKEEAAPQAQPQDDFPRFEVPQLSARPKLDPLPQTELFSISDGVLPNAFLPPDPITPLQPPSFQPQPSPDKKAPEPKETVSANARRPLPEKSAEQQLVTLLLTRMDAANAAFYQRLDHGLIVLDDAGRSRLMDQLAFLLSDPENTKTPVRTVNFYGDPDSADAVVDRILTVGLGTLFDLHPMLARLNERGRAALYSYIGFLVS